MILFAERTNLFVHPVEEKTIVAYMSGLEAGSDFHFSKGFNEFLADTYDIYGSNEGWSLQVRLYAEKSRIEFNSAFSLLVQEYLKTI